MLMFMILASFLGGKVGNVNPGSINPQCTNRVATSF